MGTLRAFTGDGGGGRGQIIATLVNDIEKDIGPLHQHVHFFMGTSAGGMNFAALSEAKQGDLYNTSALHSEKVRPFLSAAELEGFYTDRGPEIFDRSLLRTFRTANGLILESKYGPENLQSMTNDVFGNAMLSDVRTRLMVTAYDIVNRKPVVFKSWEAAGVSAPDGSLVYDPAKDFLLSDVVMSTTAAPTYFPPHVAHSMDGKAHHLIDGGVWANNPSQVALAEMRAIFGDTHDFLVVSFGTGETERSIQAEGRKDWSVAGWLRNGLVSLLMDAPTSAIDRQMREERNVSYHRLQMDLKRREANTPAPNDDLDDTSPENLARLKARAEEFLHNNRDYMSKLKTYFTYNALPNYEELLEEANHAARKREKNRDPIMSLPTYDEFGNSGPL